MNQLLSVKERMIHMYQKTGIILVPILKFLIAFLVFTLINARIGYDLRFSGIEIGLLCALFCAFVPSSVTVLLAAALVLVHVYCVSKILAVIVSLFFLVIYLMFIRLTPKQGYALLAIPILFPMNMAYLIPLLLGMTAAPISLAAAAGGVVVYYLINIVKDAAQISVNNTVEDILALYRYVIDSLLANKEMFLTIVIFSLVILVTYFLRRMKYDHAFGIAIASGTMVMVLGFLFGNIRITLEAGIVNMIAGCIFSALIMVIIQFFKLTLDYTAVERTQFEDDDYYYYVKAVPKIKLTAPEKNVVTIVPKDTGKIPELDEKEKEDFELGIFDLEETVDSKSLSGHTGAMKTTVAYRTGTKEADMKGRRSYAGTGRASGTFASSEDKDGASHATKYENPSDFHIPLVRDATLAHATKAAKNSTGIGGTAVASRATMKDRENQRSGRAAGGEGRNLRGSRTGIQRPVSDKNQVDEELRQLKSFTDDINDFSPIETRRKYTGYTGRYGKNTNRK